MAVPLIINVSPTSGATGGRNLVELKTNNARLPPEPPLTGPVQTGVQETVQVLFGTEAATEVKVLSRGRVLCLAPIHDPGVVDVTINNLDDNGDPIAGETFTLTSAYTYARPNLTTRSEFTRLVRELIIDMERQIVDNVQLTVHTDYDDTTADTLNITKIASMPGIILVGPDTDENRFFSLNGFQRFVATNADLSITEFHERRPPYTVDVSFVVIGVAELTAQLLDLMSATILYFHKNKFFTIDKDPNDSTAGKVSYEMDWAPDGGEPDVTTRLGESNVRTFTGTMLIRGVDLEALAGFSEDDLVNKVQGITEVKVNVDPRLVVQPDDPTVVVAPFPFDDDDLPASPVDFGDFDVTIDEAD